MTGNWYMIRLMIVIVFGIFDWDQTRCFGSPITRNRDNNEWHLLHHFKPSMNEERISQVNVLLAQLHRQANQKHFSYNGHSKMKNKAAWDTRESNYTVQSMVEMDQEITVQNNSNSNSILGNIILPPAFAEKYLFEGDILLTPEQIKRILDNTAVRSQVAEKQADLIRRRQKRTALINGDSNRWRSMPIRYVFDVSLDESDKQPIRDALEFWRTHTCISFLNTPSATDGDLISFFKGNGCYSMIGKMGGKQGISIGDGCAVLGVAAHEIGHALGLWHEQSRADSDRYIRILNKNVIDGTLGNFLRRGFDEMNSYGVPYDLGSVMHYGPTAFSLDSNKHTIETLLPGYQRTIGQRQQPSFLDVKAINKAYCDNRCPSPLPCQYGGYTHPLSCDQCICPDGLTGTYCERPADSRNANCGAILGVNDEWTTITSPNYPQTYGKDQRCAWLLRAVPGARVQFEFVDDFGFYCTPTCYDYVEIKNDTDFTNTGMRFCCSDRPTDTFYSTTNEMLVIFNSQTPNDIGFRGRARQYPLPSPESTSTTMSTSTTGSTSTTTSATTTSTTITSTESSTTSIDSTITSTVSSTSTDSTGSTGQWSSWSSWSECSKTCGACGVKSRQRRCVGNCQGHSQQFTRCSFEICPGDTTCSKLTFLDFPCGDGRVCSSAHEVTVKCTFPSCCAPYKPGKTRCELARNSDSIPFEASLLADDSESASSGQWSEWSECFGPKCGGCARQVRHRMCQDDLCRERDREFRPCNMDACTSCNNSSSYIVEAPCTDSGERIRKELCLRPKRRDEVTCPCCAPYKEENGKCI